MPEADSMLWRLLIVLAFPLLLLLCVKLLRRWQLARARSADKATPRRIRGPAVVYFWSADCQLCRTTQKPILERLDGVALHSHQVEAFPDLAKAWGVTTLPTTFVVHAEGDIRHVNNGLVNEATLRRQLGLPQMASIVPSTTRSTSS